MYNKTTIFSIERGGFMNQYDFNVEVVKGFLKQAKFNSSRFSTHNSCYREFRTYLLGRNSTYSKEASECWQKENQNVWPKWRAKEYRICLKRLEEVYNQGYPNKDHKYEYPTRYNQLNTVFQRELDEYILQFKSNDKIYLHNVKMQSAEFLVFLQMNGKVSICEVGWDDIYEYFYEVEQNRTKKLVDIYRNRAKNILLYYANKSMIS